MKHIYFAALLLTAAPCAALAGTVTFDTETLRDDSVVNATLDSATATVDGLTITFSATAGGVLDDYNNTGPQGIAIGAPANGGVNTDFSGNTNPDFGSYAISFDQAITSINISFGFLTDFGTAPETISNFSIDAAALPSGSISASGLTNTQLTLDPDTISAINGVRNGLGNISFAGGPFNSFGFDHSQDPINIGFVITSVTVETAAAVPLPAGLPLLLTGGALFGFIRRRKLASSAS